MDIEFNPSRRADQVDNQPIKRAPAPATPNETASVGSAQNLEKSVKDLPLVRPEQVARARALVEDAKYPPEKMLNSIANLLALHLRQ